MSGSKVLTSIPSISSFSSDEIEGFLNFSSAARVYFELLQNDNLDPVYKLRHTAWMEVALSNFHNQSTQEYRSLYWSNAMDEIVKLVFNKYFSSSDPVMILGLGKFGSQVLNLSSDIDILIITDEATNPDILKKTRNFIQHLNAKTEYGFLTRVDLNLKPSDLSGPIINAKQLASYLWQSQQLWERLVYTRARKITGQLNDELSLFSEIQKFCFRKYIRLDLVDGLSDLLNKILSHNQNENNLKLCPGGIRSIELMLSALQLLYGGKTDELQSANTYKIFSSIKKLNLVPTEDILALEKNYNILRSQEDLVQSMSDEQNHTMSNLGPLRKNLNENQIIIENFSNKIKKNSSKDPYKILDQLQELSSKHLHLNDLLQFLKKNPSYISLFNAHPKSYENLLKSLTYSPQVAKLITLRPDLLDLFLIKKVNFDLEDSDEDFLIQLADFKAISQITAIGEFLTEFNIKKLLLKVSKTADFCVLQIAKRVFKNENVRILKLGKWTADELGVFSDLDFIFVYDGSADPSKLSRKFISYLTHATFHGPLYNIDLRLRPSGNAGPILTSQNKLIEYLSLSSPIWLRQAYLRNCFLDNSTQIRFNLKDLTTEEKAEIVDIRNKRLTHFDGINLSFKDNFGGIVDLEFLIQSHFLNINCFPSALDLEGQIEELEKLRVLTTSEAVYFKETYKVLRFFEQLCEILFKANTLTEKQFQKIIEIDGVQKVWPNFRSFSDLVSQLKSNSVLVKKSHPFVL